jgi:hypothetical protein
MESRALVQRDKFTAIECNALFGLSKNDLEVLDSLPSTSKNAVVGGRLYTGTDIQTAIDAKTPEISNFFVRYWTKLTTTRRPSWLSPHDSAVLLDRFTLGPGFHIQLNGGFKLPNELLYQVMDDFVNDHEPKGIRGVSLIVNDLLSLSVSCKPLFIAAQYGFRALERKLPPIKLNGEVDEMGDAFVESAARDPRSLTKGQLKRLLSAMKLKKSGNLSRNVISSFSIPSTYFNRVDCPVCPRPELE